MDRPSTHQVPEGTVAAPSAGVEAVPAPTHAECARTIVAGANRGSVVAMVRQAHRLSAEAPPTS
ncbi:MAG: hypothetical protein M3P53_06665 [Actinomycetota bacterium]|nr:hypothetical protein [Actinomycetota bacterium]